MMLTFLKLLCNFDLSSARRCAYVMVVLKLRPSLALIVLNYADHRSALTPWSLRDVHVHAANQLAFHVHYTKVSFLFAFNPHRGIHYH